MQQLYCCFFLINEWLTLQNNMKSFFTLISLLDTQLSYEALVNWNREQQPPLPTGHWCSSWPQSPPLPSVSP